MVLKNNEAYEWNKLNINLLNIAGLYRGFHKKGSLSNLCALGIDR